MTTVINLDKAKEKIKENRYAIDAWNILIKDAQEKTIEETRQFFEELVDHFPTCGKFWKIYIDQELKAKNYQNVEKLFERSLNNILHIDLWKCYLAYLKESKSKHNNYNKLIVEAYDMALKKIGLDVMSYSLWLDYINFLKALEQMITSKQEKDLLLQSIRKIYLDALRNPMINIEQMWKEYCQFESILSGENAKSLIEEASKEFQIIKKISREYESVTRPLERHLPALPPDQIGNADEEMRQLRAWKRYILWEKQNPLKLTTEQAIMKRVMFAYEQSFLCLAYHCDIWHEAACYLNKQSKLFKDKDDELRVLAENAASNLYERATNTFMRNNPLIYLAYANFEERRTNFQKVYEIYDKCLQNQEILNPTLVWIQYIRFVRRHEDINAARKLFKRAREDPRSTYHLFIANANLEYFCTKDKTIGFNIFHLGAKKFAKEPEYMLAYIKYMSHLNEDNNTRVLFERILGSDDLTPQQTTDIWSEFLKFECAVGDLASILKVDKKRQKVFESIPNLTEFSESTLMIDRYKYLDLLPCNQNELKAMGYKDIPIKQITPSQTIESTSLSSNLSLTPADFALAAANELKKSKFPVPDTTQMLPFKPIRNALPLMHSIAGGIFPFPPAVTDLVKRLPPPSTFEGPFVIIDELISNFQQMELTDEFQPLYVYINGEPIRELEHLSNNLTSQPIQTTKRTITNASNSDDEDSKRSKTMDIYKQRQYKKLIKNA